MFHASFLPDYDHGRQPVRHYQISRKKVTGKTLNQLRELWHLSITHKKCNKLPDEIGNMITLKNLWLRGTSIKDLPETIRYLIALTALNMSHNSITSFPMNILLIPNLTELYLNNNLISELPGAISNMRELRTLNLEDNRLSALPDSLCTLKKLSNLILKGNQIRSLPYGFFTNSFDVQICHINIANNSVRITLEIPDTEGTADTQENTVVNSTCLFGKIRVTGSYNWKYHQPLPPK